MIPLKGDKAISPGQRPGVVTVEICALKGQKRCILDSYNCFCPFRAQTQTPKTPGRCPGLDAYWPFRPLLLKKVYRTPITDFNLLTKVTNSRS